MNLLIYFGAGQSRIPLDYNMHNSATPAGHGQIAVSIHAGKAILSASSSTYPLKLLSPYIHDETALVYLMTYGGGLVGGDEIVVDVKVQSGARLLLLSQVRPSS